VPPWQILWDFSLLQAFLSLVYWAPRLRLFIMPEPSPSRRAMRERRLRELPTQMRCLIWEARLLAPPRMHDNLVDWTPRAMALVDQLHKIIAGRPVKPAPKPSRSR